MSDARATLAMIQEFVTLAMERRQRQLPTDRRERMEALDEALRENIDGAKPAPKRIANPSAASGPSAPSRAATPVPSTMASALSDALDEGALNARDEKKVRSVDDVPKSGYTPPRTPAFMQDYFSDDIIPVAVTADLVPKDVVDPSGESIDLDRESRILLGLERPPPRAAAPRAAPRAASVKPVAKPRGTPVIVHMMAGGTQRGQVDGFDPDSGHVEVTMKNGDRRDVTLHDVLAIFFGTRQDAPGEDPHGTALVVKLVNDRQVSGLSPDYEEGANALTVVPNPRRGNIDRIWVPAWAVKAIELA